MSESEIHQKVANELNIDVNKVVEYDKKFWQHVKLSLNNPDFDVLEIPFFGSFTMTKPKLFRTLRFSIRILRKMNIRLNKNPENGKLRMDIKIQNELFNKLWKLKKEIKF